MKRFLPCLFLCGSLFAADVYTLARRDGLTGNLWTDAGVPGGWPQRSTIFTTLTSSASAATINNAIASCPSNQVVKLGAGTYNLGNNRINLNKDGVTLRGTTNSSGVPTTLFNNCDIHVGASDWPSTHWGSFTGRSITNGLAVGSTSIMLNINVPADFGVGDIFMIDQTDDGTLVKADSGADSTQAHRGGRSYVLFLHCLSKSGHTITFEPAIIGPYWSTSRSPQAVGFSSVDGPTFKSMGLEDIKHDSGTTPLSYNIVMARTWGTWIRNVWTTGWPTSGGGTGIQGVFNAGGEIKWCYLHDQPAVANSSYALEMRGASFMAIEHNIFTNLPLAMPIATLSGSSVSYNYAVGPVPYDPTTWNPEYFFTHGGHCYLDLFEGNWIMSPLMFDEVYNTSDSYIGVVRNRLIGWVSGHQDNNYPIILDSGKNNFTIVGNVMGQKGYHVSYEGSIPKIFAIDSSNSGVTRTNNYNTVDQGIHASELIGSLTMANSYRFSSKPGDFGDRRWPTFDPVSSNTNTTAYTNQPAGYRAFFGAFPPAGGGGPTVPGPPTGLQIIRTASTTLQLQYVAPSDDGGAAITNYKIYRSLTPGNETLLTTIGNVLTYDNTGLSPATYYYKVSAVNSVGEGALSDEASGTIDTLPFLAGHVRAPLTRSLVSSGL